MRDSAYFKQAELMLRSIPHVTAETCFALKGGTAINLFVQDMPRLSVDLDLAYLPVDETRETALKNISDGLSRIAAAIQKTIPGTRVQKALSQSSDRVTKLVVAAKGTRIKLEVNEVIRGAVFSVEEHELTQRAADMFELSVTARTLSIADLYGGKFCAALDRQHPRDLFDVKVLLENVGITQDIRRAFVVYLASHDRPIHELLDPTRKDIRRIFETEFVGMPLQDIKYEELIAARETLVTTILRELTDNEKTFLVSLKVGKPDWSLLEIEGVQALPSIQWKLMNIQRMAPRKRTHYLEKLKTILGMQKM